MGVFPLPVQNIVHKLIFFLPNSNVKPPRQLKLNENSKEITSSTQLSFDLTNAP